MQCVGMNTQSHNAPLSSMIGLQQWCDDNGFGLEEAGPDEVSVIDREVGSIWSIFRVDEWLQVKGLMFDQIDPTQALGLSLMRLHERLLGGRYAIDDANNLILIADVLPHDQSAGAVAAAITQLQSLYDDTHDLLRRVLDTGIAADEQAIDQAFNIGGVSLH